MSTLNHWMELSHPIAFILIAATVFVLVAFTFRKFLGGKGSCCGPQQKPQPPEGSNKNCCN